MQEFAKTCIEAARVGAAVLLDWRGRFEIRTKGLADLVTEADVAAQQAIRDHIARAYPDHDFLGEESPAPSERRGPFRWIVDPLDGTTNYAHHFPHYSVSIALEKGDDLLVAAIVDPERGESFTAVRGQGAQLNGRPIAPSAIGSLGEALTVTGFPPGIQKNSLAVGQFEEVLCRAQSVRRLGSAALNLAYVASGRLDAFWALDNRIWDIAAGVLILREAGGIITDMDGGPLNLEHPRLISAGTALLHNELRELLGKVGSESDA